MSTAAPPRRATLPNIITPSSVPATHLETIDEYTPPGTPLSPSRRPRASTLRYGAIIDLLDGYDDAITAFENDTETSYDEMPRDTPLAVDGYTLPPLTPKTPFTPMTASSTSPSSMRVPRLPSMEDGFTQQLHEHEASEEEEEEEEDEDDPELDQELKEVAQVLESVFAATTDETIVSGSDDTTDRYEKPLPPPPISPPPFQTVNASESSSNVRPNPPVSSGSVNSDTTTSDPGDSARPRTGYRSLPPPAPAPHLTTLPLPPVPNQLVGKQPPIPQRTDSPKIGINPPISRPVTSPPPRPTVPKPSHLVNAATAATTPPFAIPRAVKTATMDSAKMNSHRLSESASVLSSGGVIAIDAASPPKSHDHIAKAMRGSQVTHPTRSDLTAELNQIRARAQVYSEFCDRERAHVIALRRLCETYVYPFRAYALQHVSRATRKGSLAQQLNAKVRDMLGGGGGAGGSGGTESSVSGRVTLTPDQVDDIFVNVEEILARHKKVIRIMEVVEFGGPEGEGWTATTGISEAMAQLIPLMRSYTVYIEAHSKALSTLDQLTADSASFRKLLEGCCQSRVIRSGSTRSTDTGPVSIREDAISAVFGESPLAATRRMSASLNSTVMDTTTSSSRKKRSSSSSSKRTSTSIIEAGDDLLSLLSQPLQRVVQYHLFMDSWLKEYLPPKHPDRPSMEKTWAQFRVASYEAMRSISRTHNMLRILELRQAIPDLPRQIPGPDARLLHLGILYQIGTPAPSSSGGGGSVVVTIPSLPNEYSAYSSPSSLVSPSSSSSSVEEPRLCVLFDNVFVWAREYKGSWQFLSSLPLRGAFVIPVSNTNERRWCWRLTGPRDSHRALVLSAKSEEERREWINKVGEAIRKVN